MSTQLYTKFADTGSKVKTDQRTMLNRALAVLVLHGSETRVLGRAPVPKGPIRFKNGWTGDSYKNDKSPMPNIAWSGWNELDKAGITILDALIFHEPKGKDRLDQIIKRLPKVDLNQVKAMLTNGAAWVGTKSSVVRSKINLDRAVRFFRAAEPTVAKAAQLTGKLIIGASVAASAIATMLALGLLYVLANDPVLVVIVPAEDGGDPVWIEIARWLE